MNTIISAEIFNSLCKICKEHGWYMPEENFRKVYKNIEESKTGVLILRIKLYANLMRITGF